MWKHKAIRMNRTNLVFPDSKAGKREIAIERNANANSAIAKDKVASRAVAASRRVVVSREAVSKAGDRPSALD
jgi:hypothetical protein